MMLEMLERHYKLVGLNQQFELVGGTFPSSYVPYNANTSSNQEILPYLKEGGDIGIRWSEASDL